MQEVDGLQRKRSTSSSKISFVKPRDGFTGRSVSKSRWLNICKAAKKSPDRNTRNKANILQGGSTNAGVEMLPDRNTKKVVVMLQKRTTKREVEMLLNRNTRK